MNFSSEYHSVPTIAKKILFRADAKPSIGNGDLMSLIHLSKRFSKEQWQCYFLIRDYDAGIKLISKYELTNVDIIPANISPNEEVELINRFCVDKKIDALFICITERPITELQGFPPGLVKGCVNFDQIITKEWDLVVNWDPAAIGRYNEKKHPSTVFLLGPEYVILPYNFDWNKIEKRNFKKIPETLLIAMGGGDENNLTEKIVRVIGKIKCNLNLIIVIGSGYCHKSILEKTLESNLLNYKIIENTNNMFDLYLKADLAICTGGLTVSELVATRTPTLVVSAYEHQKARCQYFHKLSIVHFLGEGAYAINANSIKEGIDFVIKQGGVQFNNKFIFKKDAILNKITSMVHQK